MVTQKAYVEIVEEPAPKTLRFRYECEGRSAGSLPGISTTPENKTFPTIRVEGFRGKAYVVVSCVTKDAPYRPHPHSLVGREGCNNGVCKLDIPRDSMSVTFSNLGIQCVKKKDIEKALRRREQIGVDPFGTGFLHRSKPTSIDLNKVRLCFQVFVEITTKDKNNVQIIKTVPLKPVVSIIVHDKKTVSDLTIVKLSECVSPVDGGRKDIILLCEKVLKEDIQVRFYEEKDDQVVWEGFGDFQPSQVYKQNAIWFKAPRYKNLDITEPVKVFVQLRKPSDGTFGEPLPFEFLPMNSGGKRKRLKPCPMFMPPEEQEMTNIYDMPGPPMWNLPPLEELIKMESSESPRTNEYSPENYALPCVSTILPQSWNVYNGFSNEFIQNNQDNSSFTSLLDLDSQQMEMRVLHPRELTILNL